MSNARRYPADFDERYERRGEDECWPWLGGFDAYGYGRFYVGKVAVKAHRHALARKLSRDLLPSDIARHTCDNPPCVNPRHLVPGTIHDNNRDRVERGRTEHMRGEGNQQAKLTAEDVQLIRFNAALGETHDCLAFRFGVSRPAISMIVARKRWRHV